MIGDHKTARNLVAIEAVHYGLDTATAARLAGRLEGMGHLRDDTELNRIRRELEELSKGLERKAERAQRNRAYSAAVGYRETAKKITRILDQEEA